MSGLKCHHMFDSTSMSSGLPIFNTLIFGWKSSAPAHSNIHYLCTQNGVTPNTLKLLAHKQITGCIYKQAVDSAFPWGSLRLFQSRREIKIVCAPDRFYFLLKTNRDSTGTPSHMKQDYQFS